jgi:hypothetical protein
MSYYLPGLGQGVADLIPDPWTQSKLSQSRSSGVGQAPPPVAPIRMTAVVGWTAMVLAAAGLFYAVSYKPKSAMRKNKRKRRTSRFSFSMTGPRVSWDHSPDLKVGESQFSSWLNQNALTDAQRAKLPLSVFVFPERRAWPLDKASRAYDAIRMMRLGRVRSASDFNKLRNAIRTRFPQVWAEYGKTLTWDRVKRAKGKARTSRAATVARKQRRSIAANGIKWYYEGQHVGADRMSKDDLVDLLTSPFGGHVGRLSTRNGTFEWDPRSGSLYYMMDMSSSGDDPHGRRSRKIGTYRSAESAGNAALKFQRRIDAAWERSVSRRRVTRNAAKKRASKKPSKPKFSELDAVMAVGIVRSSTTPKSGDVLPPGVMAKFKKLPPGLYKYGMGPKKGEVIQRFKAATLKGAIMSTRIGAKSVGEYHWVVDNFDPSFPVVVRGIDNSGKTFFRVEEFAKKFVREPLMISAVKSKSAKR